MLPTTIVKNELAWALAIIGLGWGSAFCSAQDETYQGPASGQQSTVFEKLFGKSTSQSNQSSEAKKTKPKVPATTTAGKPNRSGFMIPLKSFSRGFRAPVESEEIEQLPEMNSGIATQPRIPREPFRSLPRVQERRERDTIDLRVEEIAQEQPATKQRTSSTSPTSPAPIITSESIKSSATVSTSSKTATKPAATKPVVAGSSKTNTSEIQIESNSTSRRTAMEVDTPTNRFTEKPRDEAKSQKSLVDSVSKSPSAIKNASESRGLIDLGFASEKSSKGPIASSSRDLDSTRATTKPYTDNRSQSQGAEIQRTAPPTTQSSKRDNKETLSITQGTPSSDTAVSSSSLHREMFVPGVRVTVNGPNAILIDSPTTFEVIAKNEGSETLNGLIVRIAVPTHVSVSDVNVTEGVALPENDQDGNTIIWELPQLPAGSYKRAVVNLKTLKPEHFALGVEWTVLPQNAEMQIEVQQPQLAIALEGPSEVIFGKPQLYRIRVRNTGNADVKAVSVAMSAEPYGSNQSEIGDISAGSERIVEVELTFQQSGSLPIVATATSALSKLDARSSIDVIVRQSDLIATWFGPAEFYQGSVIDYELELNNVGSVAAMGTNCIVKLPAGTEIVSMPPGATRSGDSIKWEIKKIEPNEKLSIPFRLSMSKLGNNQLLFTGLCNSSNDAKAEFQTNIDAIADLHLSVVDPAAPAPVGQPVVYEVIIANRGKKAASDVEVIAQFSEGIEPVRVEGHTGRIVPGQAIFNLIPTINSNEKLVLRIHAEASKPGVHRFRVEVKSKGSDADLLEEESTRYLATSIKGDRR